MKKRLMKSKLMRIVALAVIAILLLGGVVLAYTLIWEGGASITIEVPEPNGNGNGGVTPDPEPEPPLALEVGAITVTSGCITDGVWVVTLQPGESESITVDVFNPRDTYVDLQPLINREPSFLQLGPGVIVEWFTESILPNSTGQVRFAITANVAATATAFPNVSLEIRE